MHGIFLSFKHPMSQRLAAQGKEGLVMPRRKAESQKGRDKPPPLQTQSGPTCS